MWTVTAYRLRPGVLAATARHIQVTDTRADSTVREVTITADETPDQPARYQMGRVLRLLADALEDS